MPVCAQCGTDNPDIARFCLACGAQLVAPPAAQEVRKVVTIVFSDLKGSTAMGERLDPEAVREVMSRYFDTMRAELERHGGVVEKYIGDAVMAVFGLPKLHEDDALRAVRAAFGMQEALAELNDELDRRFGVRLANRTGVNTGEVVAGDPSTGQRLVTGDTVNVAARLEQAAGEREVLLGELTYRLVRDAVEVESVEPLELKGKAERVPAYRLVSVAETGEGWGRRHDTPMVGRNEELGALVSMFAEAFGERAPRLVTVIGDAGVGKSRLHNEFLHLVRGRARILRGRCLSYGEGITFWPLVEAVRQAAGIREDDPPEAALAKLSSLAGAGNTDVVERVASAVGLGVEQFSLEELFWGIRKLFELLAREEPLVVLFDDIHWAEPTFLELVEHLLDSAEDTPLLLLCPARHDLLERHPEWAERAGAARIVLRPLTAEDMQAVVGNLLGEAGIAEAARARIVAAADGNPLFVEQMLSMLIDHGLLRFEHGHWTAASDLSDLSVPPTIQALLAARLDGLTGDERGVVEPASVIGHIFAEPAVEALVAEAARAGVHEHLSILTRKQLVGPDLSALEEERFRFNHVLIREAAYSGLLKRARATFHERFVQWADVVNRERGREIEYEEILGYHLEQAYRYLSELGPIDDHGRELGTDGSRRLASAGRRAFARADMAAAANLLGRAVSVLLEDDSRRLELLPDYGEVLIHSGRFDDARAVLAEAIDRGTAAGLPAVSSHAELVRILVQLRAGDPEAWSEDEALATIERAKVVFQERGDNAGLARAWRSASWIHGVACRFGDAAEASLNAIEHAQRAGDVRQQARATTGYASAVLLGPTQVREGITQCERLVGELTGDRQSEGMLLGVLAVLLAMQGSFGEARRRLLEARSMLVELGLDIDLAAAALQAWRIEMLAGEIEAAERELRAAYDRLVELGEKLLLCTVAGLLGQTLYVLGRFDEAEPLARLARELASEDDVETQALWRCLQAKLLARQGQMDESEALVQEALDLLAPTDGVLYKHGALLDLAEIRLLAGRNAEEILAEARALAEAKESPAMAVAVETFLAATA